MYGYKVHLLKKYSTVNKELHSVSTCAFIKSRNLILAFIGNQCFQQKGEEQAFDRVKKQNVCAVVGDNVLDDSRCIRVGVGVGAGGDDHETAVL